MSLQTTPRTQDDENRNVIQAYGFRLEVRTAHQPVGAHVLVTGTGLAVKTRYAGKRTAVGSIPRLGRSPFSSKALRFAEAASEFPGHN